MVSNNMLKVATVLCLTIGLIYPSKPLIQKYMEGQTTTTSRYVDLEEMEFPAISICPGFKEEHAIKYDWFLKLIGPQSWQEEEVDFTQENISLSEVWEEVNFSLEEFIQDYKPTTPNLDNETLAEPFVKVFDTWSGRCFTFLPQGKAKFGDFAAIKVNSTYFMNKRLHLPVMIHHPDLMIGLNGMFWPGPVDVGELPVGKLGELLLSPTRTFTTFGTVANERDRYTCLVKKFTNWLRQRHETDSELCYFPMFKHVFIDIAKMGNLTECRSTSQLQHAKDQMHQMLEQKDSIEFQEACPRPKEETKFMVTSRHDIASIIKDGMSCIVIKFAQMKVEILEEYKLMDGFDLLSSLGGLVGIFLGWSFIHAFDLIIHYSIWFMKGIRGQHDY